MTLEELKVIISAETSKFNSSLNDAVNQTKSASKNINNQTDIINNAFGKIKSAFTFAAIGAAAYKGTKALIGLGRQAIGIASNLTEVQNVVDVAFGDMSWKAERFASNSIQQFGMSELSAKKTASTYMAMASSMGLGANKASDMAISLAGLTGDVASFYNISQELADVKLRSVFTGETETLKDLGIVMTQTNLQQYALSQGITTNINNMSQAELVTLRYNYVMQQLSLAQGDFARTSGTWANQVRILQEQWKQLLGIIGSGLVAVFTPVIRVLNTVIGKVITVANVIAGVFGKLFGKKSNSAKASTKQTTKAINSVGNSSKSAGSSMKSAGNSSKGLNKSLKGTEGQAKKTAKALGTLASIDEINNIDSSDSSGAGGSGGNGGTGAGGVGDGGYDIGGIDWGEGEDKADKGSDKISKAVDKILKKLKELRKWFDENQPVIIALIAGIVAGFLAFETIMHWGAIVSAVTALIAPFQQLWLAVSNWGVLSVIQGVLGTTAGAAAIVAVAIGAVVAALVYLYQTSETFRKLVIDALNALMEILKNIYKNILQPLFSFLLDVFNTIIVPIATFLAKVFVKAVEAVATVALSFWKNIMAPLANFLVTILSIALKGVIEMWESMKPVINTVGDVINFLWKNILSPLVDFVVGNLTNSFKTWGNIISKIVASVTKIFQGLIDYFVGVFTRDADKAWKGIQQIFEGFSGFLKTIFYTDWTKSLGLLGVGLNGFLAKVKSIWEMAKGVFNGIITFIKGAFSGNWRKAWEGVKQIFHSVISGLGNIFKAPLNAIISGINTFIRGINKIKVPSWVPGVGGKGFHISEVPRLAKGAVVDRATPAVFGEAGPEAVIPLQRNTRGLDMIAERLIERMPVQEGGGNATYVINLVLEDGKVITKMVIDNIKDYEARTGKPVFDY